MKTSQFYGLLAVLWLFFYPLYYDVSNVLEYGYPYHHNVSNGIIFTFLGIWLIPAILLAIKTTSVEQRER